MSAAIPTSEGHLFSNLLIAPFNNPFWIHAPLEAAAMWSVVNFPYEFVAHHSHSAQSVPARLVVGRFGQHNTPTVCHCVTCQICSVTHHITAHTGILRYLCQRKVLKKKSSLYDLNSHHHDAILTTESSPLHKCAILVFPPPPPPPQPVSNYTNHSLGPLPPFV